MLLLEEASIGLFPFLAAPGLSCGTWDLFFFSFSFGKQEL